MQLDTLQATTLANLVGSFNTGSYNQGIKVIYNMSFAFTPAGSPTLVMLVAK